MSLLPQIESSVFHAKCHYKEISFSQNVISCMVQRNSRCCMVAILLCFFFLGGSFLVSGSTDHIIRIYQMTPGPPERVAELDVHSVCILQHFCLIYLFQFMGYKIY